MFESFMSLIGLPKYRLIHNETENYWYIAKRLSSYRLDNSLNINDRKFDYWWSGLGWPDEYKFKNLKDAESKFDLFIEHKQSKKVKPKLKTVRAWK